ncbi:MAG TPA: two-component system response regulator CreB [Rhodocyclaceae bacterium]
MTDAKRILIVEDETAIAEPLLYVLQSEGYATTHLLLGQEAVAAHGAQPFDLVVLDVGLPDGPGFEVLRRLRQGVAGADVPVMFLTARGDEIDRVVGLELGADDYVVKPFSPREVAARIRAILRRGRAAALQVDAVWQHDPAALRVRYHGAALDLTRNEYRLLEMLLGHPGRIFSREEIMDRVWADAPDSSDRTIDAHIKTLRAKLRAVRADADPIRTHRGLGYSLE